MIQEYYNFVKINLNKSMNIGQNVDDRRTSDYSRSQHDPVRSKNQIKLNQSIKNSLQYDTVPRDNLDNHAYEMSQLSPMQIEILNNDQFLKRPPQTDRIITKQTQRQQQFDARIFGAVENFTVEKFSPHRSSSSKSLSGRSRSHGLDRPNYNLQESPDFPFPSEAMRTVIFSQSQDNDGSLRRTVNPSTKLHLLPETQRPLLNDSPNREIRNSLDLGSETQFQRISDQKDNDDDNYTKVEQQQNGHFNLIKILKDFQNRFAKRQFILWTVWALIFSQVLFMANLMAEFKVFDINQYLTQVQHANSEDSKLTLQTLLESPDYSLILLFIGQATGLLTIYFFQFILPVSRVKALKDPQKVQMFVLALILIVSLVEVMQMSNLHNLVNNLRPFQAQLETNNQIGFEEIEEFNQVFKVIESTLNETDSENILEKLIRRLQARILYRLIQFGFVNGMLLKGLAYLRFNLQEKTLEKTPLLQTKKNIAPNDQNGLNSQAEMANLSSSQIGQSDLFKESDFHLSQYATPDERRRIEETMNDQKAFNQNNFILRINIHIMALNFLFRTCGSAESRFVALSISVMVIQSLTLVLIGLKLYQQYNTSSQQEKKQDDQEHQNLSNPELIEHYQAGPPNINMDDREERGGFGDDPEIMNQQLVSQSVYTELQSGSCTATEYLSKSQQMGGGHFQTRNQNRLNHARTRQWNQENSYGPSLPPDNLNQTITNSSHMSNSVRNQQFLVNSLVNTPRQKVEGPNGSRSGQSDQDRKLNASFLSHANMSQLMRGDKRVLAEVDLPVEFVLQYLKAMERHDILKNHQNFQTQNTEDKLKCDLTFKFYIKNIAILMLLVLLTQSLILLSESNSIQGSNQDELRLFSVFTVIGLVFGIVSGQISTFFISKCTSQDIQSEQQFVKTHSGSFVVQEQEGTNQRIKIMMAQSCTGAFFLTLFSYFEQQQEDDEPQYPYLKSICIMIAINSLVAVILDITQANQIEIIGLTKPFYSELNDNDDYFELQLKQYIFQTQFSQLPVENETTSAVLFIQGIVIAISCYQGLTRGAFGGRLALGMICFWLQFILLFLDCQARQCIRERQQTEFRELDRQSQLWKKNLTKASFYQQTNAQWTQDMHENPIQVVQKDEQRNHECDQRIRKNAILQLQHMNRNQKKGISLGDVLQSHQIEDFVRFYQHIEIMTCNDQITGSGDKVYKSASQLSAEPVNIGIHYTHRGKYQSINQESGRHNQISPIYKKNQKSTTLNLKNQNSIQSQNKLAGAEFHRYTMHQHAGSQPQNFVRLNSHTQDRNATIFPESFLSDVLPAEQQNPGHNFMASLPHDYQFMAQSSVQSEGNEDHMRRRGGPNHGQYIGLGASVSSQQQTFGRGSLDEEMNPRPNGNERNN